MKAYITKSLAAAKAEVKEWLHCFNSHGLGLEINKISLIPKFYPDDVAPNIDEVGFEPIQVEEAYDYNSSPEDNSSFSYDDYFRIEEILTTGKYRYHTAAGEQVEIRVEELSYSKALEMLIEWGTHMGADGISVKWTLPVF